MHMNAYHIADPPSVLGALAVSALLLGVVVAGLFVAYRTCVVPGRASEDCAFDIAASISGEARAQEYLRAYRLKRPKSVLIAWLLSIFMTPTLSYAYQGNWLLAVSSLVTLQGLGMWYVVAVFAVPVTVAHRNRRIAEEARVSFYL